MPRLIPCPSCRSHVLLGERQCPHCGTVLRTTFAPRAASTILLGLALAACPGDDSSNETGAGSSTGSGPGSSGMATTVAETGTPPATGSGSATTAAPTSSTSIGEPEYGVPDTGIEDSGTATDTGTGTAGSTSVGEPEYGVPETSGE